MTRIEKFYFIRRTIELDNFLYQLEHFDEYLKLKDNQKQIKMEGGYKH